MKKHGCLWWIIIGWWWWIYALPIRLLRALFKRSKAQPREVSPEPMPPAQNRENHGVAGTSFRQEAIKAMGAKNPDYAKTKQSLRDTGLTDEWVCEYEFAPQRVELQPEPDNPHDPKAIKVVVDGAHIGYIKAGSCAHIHKLLEADRILRISCVIGGGKSKRVTQDDDDGRYVLEQDEIPFYARLTITTK